MKSLLSDSGCSRWREMSPARPTVVTMLATISRTISPSAMSRPWAGGSSRSTIRRTPVVPTSGGGLGERLTPGTAGSGHRGGRR